MLAAMTSRNEHSLDTFKLVLLLQSQKQKYSEVLQKYFDAVVADSFSLLESPKMAAAIVKPESVSLALKLAADEKMYEQLKRLINAEADPAECAALVLDSLETTFDANRESAHLSREVYAAI